MRAQPIKFTGTGQVKTGEALVVGVTFTGFTAVAIYDGTDTTGTPVLMCSSTTPLHYEVRCQTGVFINCSGAGSGSVHLA